MSTLVPPLVPPLVVVELSAAFDQADPSIFLQRLEHGTGSKGTASALTSTFSSVGFRFSLSLSV